MLFDVFREEGIEVVTNARAMSPKGESGESVKLCAVRNRSDRSGAMPPHERLKNTPTSVSAIIIKLLARTRLLRS